MIYKKNNRKSQIQMGETIFVLIIIIIIIIIGVKFWSNMEGRDIKKMASQADELSVIEVSKMLSEMPELNCYHQSVKDLTCVDLYKLMALSDAMNNPDTHDMIYLYYNDYFKRSKITFKQVYPVNRTIIIYDSNLSNMTTKKIELPVIIEDTVNNRKNFGLVIVDGYYTTK